MAAAAVAALAADMAVDRGGDEIASAEPAHFRAQAFHGARDLVAQDDGHFHAAPEGAVTHHHVVETDPAGGNRNPDLTRSGLARRHMGDAQIGGSTGSLEDNGAHALRGAQLAASQPEMIFHLPPSAFMIAPDKEPAC